MWKKKSFLWRRKQIHFYQNTTSRSSEMTSSSLSSHSCIYDVSTMRITFTSCAIRSCWWSVRCTSRYGDSNRVERWDASFLIHRLHFTIMIIMDLFQSLFNSDRSNFLLIHEYDIFDASFIEYIVFSKTKGWFISSYKVVHLLSSFDVAELKNKTDWLQDKSSLLYRFLTNLVSK